MKMVPQTSFGPSKLEPSLAQISRLAEALSVDSCRENPWQVLVWFWFGGLFF